jgi:hypothetical protein
MNWDTIKITRKELYEQVWAEPVTKIARRYGFSDVWLAKICKRNNIPRPPRGYWARKEAGQKVQKVRLPKEKDDFVIEIHVRPPDLRQKSTDEKTSLIEKRAIPDIVIPEVLRDPHPFAEASARILASHSYGNSDILSSSSDQCLNIHVSREAFPRALRIMDTLIKTLDSMGFEVSLSDKGTTIKVFDVALSIGMGEELYRRRLKAKDHKLDGYYEFGYKLYEKQPIPSGRLFLTIGDLGFYAAGECRTNWRDTESRRLEDSLKSFISGLMKAANRKKAKINPGAERE